MIYLVECLIGVGIGFYLFHKSPETGSWVLISTVMVLAPDRGEATQFAFNRIKANLVGAVVGLMLALIHPMNVYMMALGVVLAATACELLNLKAARRSATVGVILISLAPAGKHFYEVALERAIGVVTGCMLAMLLTLIMHSLVKLLSKALTNRSIFPIN